MVKKGRKIPKAAVEPLMEACKLYSKERSKSAQEIFKGFLALMERYSDYFFSDPWPQKYDHKVATAFSDEDLEFLMEDEKDSRDRFVTLCLKKNMYMEGFMGYFGMFWTERAFHREFIRPCYKPVFDVFLSLCENEDAEFVLSKLMEQFNVKLIHNSLVDLLDYQHVNRSTRNLMDKLFDLLHTDKGLPSCRKFRCSWYRKQRDEKE